MSNQYQTPIAHKYRNKKFILCATGPSLTKEVVETIREYKDDYIIFGINDSYRLIDFLDEHYACDGKWWRMWGNDFREKYPKLSAWCYDDEGIQWGVKPTTGFFRSGLSLDQKYVHFGSNSGYQALNIAFLMGGRKFILVGYNMQRVGAASHYFGDHPPGLNNASPYKTFVDNFLTIPENIRQLIVNCTPNSALRGFRTEDLRRELENDKNIRRNVL